MGFLRVAVILFCGFSAIRAAPEIPGFRLTWSHEFEGDANSLPNPDDWIVQTGTSYPGGPPQWGTGETQTYTDSLDNIHLTGDGVLQINPLWDSSRGWTSSRIETTRTDFGAAAGEKARIQASISMPGVTGDQAIGYWPAFWTLGSSFRGNYQNWPGVGEFDIMENANGIDSVWGVMHCGTTPGGPCDETNGIGGNTACPGSPCQGNWHTYTLEIDRSSTPEALRWYVDELEFHSITQDQIENNAWSQAVHTGHFVLLNVAMGGGFPDGVFGGATPVDTTAPGFPMAVDYVAVYNT